MCVCMYVYMFSPQAKYVCMYICTYVSSLPKLCMYVCMYVLIPRNLCMYVCMYVCMYAYLYIWMCIYMYVSSLLKLCMYVCIYVCMYVCMFGFVLLYGISTMGDYSMPGTFLYRKKKNQKLFGKIIKRVKYSRSIMYNTLKWKWFEKELRKITIGVGEINEKGSEYWRKLVS